MGSRIIICAVPCAIVLWALSTACPLMAQAALGAATAAGTVRDEQAFPVVDAKISLTDNAKAISHESSSDSSGLFLFPSIAAGTYTVRVEKAGFSTWLLNDLTVEIGERAALDVSLRVGQIRTSIAVSAADAAILDTDSNVIGTVINSAQVTDLPLNGRNFLQLGLLAGGSGDVSPASTVFSANIGRPGRTIILPGTTPYSVGYFLDGVPIRGSRDGELAMNISIAAIDQFKVQESFLMPDQGANAAAINVATKSGGNQFHGEAFEFFRNGDMDARSFFALSAENLKQNQFGFALGGPVRKDRAWFHGFYEGLRQTSGFSATGYSPTPAMFAGNFAETGLTIYDPTKYSASMGTRQPFPDDMIPASRINPVSTNLLGYYLPGSSLASRPGNVFGNPQNTLNDDQGGLRVDGQISNGQQIFGEFFLQNSPAVQAGLYPLSGLLYTSKADVAILQHTWTVSPYSVNIARIAFVRAIAVGANQAEDQGSILDSVGIMNTFDNHGISGINLQGYSSFGKSNGEVGNRDNTWYLGDEFSYVRGTHSIKFGAGLGYRRGWHSNANVNALGTLNFQPAFTAQLTRNAQGQLVPQANTGNSWADFLLGLPTSGTLSGLPQVQYRATQFQPFVQDTWKISRNLTLNYGISWFLETPPDPQGWARNAVHGFDFGTGLLTYAALGQINPKAVGTDWNNFAPRFAVAWQPGNLKKTVVRAGAGTYYSEFPWFGNQYPISLGSPIGAGKGFTTAPANPVPVYKLGENVFPPLAAAPLNASYAANLPQGSLVTATNPVLRTAYVNQWNLSLQQQVARSDVIELSYLGSSSHRLLTIGDLDQCRPGLDLYCSAATRPWPQYGLLAWLDSSGNSSYEGLLAKYQHRTNRGLNLLVSYTFAKALTDAWQFSIAPSTQITSCRRCDKGPATFNVGQRLVISAVLELPFGSGHRYGSGISRGANLALGGWMLTAIATLSSGEPVYLTGPNTTGSLYLASLPNRVCSGNSSAFSSALRVNGFFWFNPSCFPVPAVGNFGNSGRTVLKGPGFDNWDLGLQKSFPLPLESSRLSLRLEMFNAWNHTQFDQPDGNAGDGLNFGRISTTRPPRLIQIGIKLTL